MLPLSLQEVTDIQEHFKQQHEGLVKEKIRELHATMFSRPSSNELLHTVNFDTSVQISYVYLHLQLFQQQAVMIVPSSQGHSTNLRTLTPNAHIPFSSTIVIFTDH
jgi:hypothetical protein